MILPAYLWRILHTNESVKVNSNSWLTFCCLLGELSRQYSPDYKLETYLKIARLFLEDEDANQADAYINRASLLQAESKNEELQIVYKVNFYTVYNIVLLNP